MMNFVAYHLTDCAKSDCKEWHKVLQIDYVNETITVLVDTAGCCQETWRFDEAECLPVLRVNHEQ